MNDYNKNNPRGNKQDNEQPGWRGPGKTFIFWIALILIMFVVYQTFKTMNPDGVEITYTEFITELENNNISEVTFEERKIIGVLKEARNFSSVNSQESFSDFTTMIPFPDFNYALVDKIIKQRPGYLPFVLEVFIAGHLADTCRSAYLFYRHATHTVLEEEIPGRIEQFLSFV